MLKFTPLRRNPPFQQQQHQHQLQQRRKKNNNCFDQTAFWNWCTEKGITSRPLEIATATTTHKKDTSSFVSSNKGRSLIVTEPIRSHGTVIAAIPYSFQSTTSTSSAMMSQTRNLSSILNAENFPLGVAASFPYLPLPRDISVFWKRKIQQQQGRRRNDNRVSERRRFQELRSTFGKEERRFLWLATVLAYSSCSPKLYRLYQPYFDLLFDTPEMIDVLPPAAIPAVQEEFNSLVSLHQDACESISMLIHSKCSNNSGMKKKNNKDLARFQTQFSFEPPFAFSGDADDAKEEQQQQLIEEEKDKVPSAQLIYHCLRLVLSRSISILPGCESLSSSSSSSSSTSSFIRSTTSENEEETEQQEEDEDSDNSNLLLLPSLVPIVDMLNHADSVEDSSSSSLLPNVNVVATAASPVDGLRRIAIVSTRPIYQGEELTTSYNLLSRNNNKNEDDPKSRALNLFRFGFE